MCIIFTVENEFTHSASCPSYIQEDTILVNFTADIAIDLDRRVISLTDIDEKHPVNR